MARGVIGLVLPAIVLAVGIALAASHALTNRSGGTAAGVTVTFSEGMRITSFDEMISPTKTPTSRGATFAFSGDQLEDRARFSVTCARSMAENTSTGRAPRYPDGESAADRGAGGLGAKPLA